MNQFFRRMQRLALALLLPLFATSALAAIPQTINYQGRLTNASDQPLGVPMPVTLSMTFKLFAAVSGGMALFSEQQSVVVNNGVFNVQIGASASLALAFDVPYFLEITIGTETLSPRQPLASAAYAFRTGCNPGDRVGCYSFASGAPGVGPCLAGVRVCNAQGTGFGACTGQVGPNCASVCADLLTDNQNCGTCGNACTGAQTCGGGGTPGICGGQAAAVCGDGIVSGMEQCDGVNLNGQTCQSVGYSGGTLACNPMCVFNFSACTAAPACGNGVIESGETCDDGNTSNGDGCSGMCQVEPGFSCVGNPSVCTPIAAVCGNGMIESGETCDDSNTNNGDGCSAMCQVEPGFSCTGNPSVCTSTSSCMSPATCPGMNTECSVRTCTAGVCGVSYSMPGTVLASQTTGDCRKRVCGNMGVVNTVIDNSDFPASQACTIGLCVAGNPVNQAANDGTMCTIPATMTPGTCNSGICQ